MTALAGIAVTPSSPLKFIVKPGGVLITPHHVTHKFLALHDTIDIYFFTAVCEDWLNNTASYIHVMQ